MKKDPLIYFDDILDSIEKIIFYTRGYTLEKFIRDSQLQDAVIRRFSVIGEAVKKISPKIRSNYRNIPWREIAGMRDVLIHEYAEVNFKRVWSVIQKDLPDLKIKIETVYQELGGTHRMI